MKIIRKNYGQGSGKEEQKLKDDELLIDRLIYRKIGSRTDNKVLQTPPAKDSEFHRWLLEMDNLHIYKYYPSLHTGPIPTPDLIALDQYLGTLGVTEVYPFQDDTYHSEFWLDGDATRTPVRYLVDASDDSLLTDSSGTEILVRY